MLWLGGGAKWENASQTDGSHSVTVWRDTGTAFEKVLDFEEIARQEAGANYFGRWPGERSKVEKIADRMQQLVERVKKLPGPPTEADKKYLEQLQKEEMPKLQQQGGDLRLQLAQLRLPPDHPFVAAVGMTFTRPM